MIKLHKKRPEPDYVYHCTSLRNLFHILNMKEPKLRPLGKIIPLSLIKNIDVRNNNTNAYRKENGISLSPYKEWPYGGVCLKIKYSKLNKKAIKSQKGFGFLMPYSMGRDGYEILYQGDIKLSQIEEIYFNPLVEYINGIFPTILMILGGAALIILIMEGIFL